MTMTPFTNNQPRTPLTQEVRNKAYHSINLEDGLSITESDAIHTLTKDIGAFDTNHGTDDVAENFLELTPEDVKAYAIKHELDETQLKLMLDYHKQHLQEYFLHLASTPNDQHMLKGSIALYTGKTFDDGNSITSEDVAQFINMWGLGNYKGTIEQAVGIQTTLPHQLNSLLLNNIT